MRAAHRNVFLTSLLLASVLTEGSARADDIEAARRDFATGVRLLQTGEYEAARAAFEKANAAHHAPAIVYNLAVTEEHLAHPQAAVDAYEAYLTEAGDAGEFSAPAREAVAQIKARSTRVRVVTTPPGARVTIDGFELADRSPVTFLVPAGRHVVVAEGEDWRDEDKIEATGRGDTFGVALRRAPPPVREPSPPAPERNGPAGFVWGAGFPLMPYHLLGGAKPPNDRAATQLMAGAQLEVGGAISERVELFARALVALGPEAEPSQGRSVSYAYMGGPGISARLGSSLWIGGTFLGGRLETVAHGAFYGTDLVFGVMGEIAVAVLDSSAGQFLLGAQPGVLFASPTDNTAFFLPLTFGYRAY